MIRATKYELVCDHCKAHYYDCMGSDWSCKRSMLKDAREHGWAIHNGEQLCPKCVAKEKSKPTGIISLKPTK